MSISALWGPVLFVARWETPAMRVLHDQARTLDIPKRQSNCKLGLKDHKTIYPMLIFPKMIEYWWCEGTKSTPNLQKCSNSNSEVSTFQNCARLREIALGLRGIALELRYPKVHPIYRISQFSNFCTFCTNPQK